MACCSHHKTSRLPGWGASPRGGFSVRASPPRRISWWPSETTPTVVTGEVGLSAVGICATNMHRNGSFSGMAGRTPGGLARVCASTSGRAPDCVRFYSLAWKECILRHQGLGKIGRVEPGSSTPRHPPAFTGLQSSPERGASARPLATTLPFPSPPKRVRAQGWLPQRQLRGTTHSTHSSPCSYARPPKPPCPKFLPQVGQNRS